MINSTFTVTKAALRFFGLTSAMNRGTTMLATPLLIVESRWNKLLVEEDLKGHKEVVTNLHTKSDNHAPYDEFDVA